MTKLVDTFAHLADDAFKIIDLKYYGDVIRNFRFRNDLTQAQLGDRIGYKASMIGAIENNRIPMPVAMIDAICAQYADLKHRRGWFLACRMNKLKAVKTELLDQQQIVSLFLKANKMDDYADFRNKRVVVDMRPRIRVPAHMTSKQAA
jgi:transcriptional regulator with XRE-family HTH domain